MFFPSAVLLHLYSIGPSVAVPEAFELGIPIWESARLSRMRVPAWRGHGRHNGVAIIKDGLLRSIHASGVDESGKSD